jgi:N-acetylglutamate synthase-like GNAT family acetyltransferase
MSTLGTLRRATRSDLESIVALQRAAYAANRAILGVEPLPLQADYAAILATMEVWCAGPQCDLAGVLILEPHSDHVLIWSIAIDPAGQSRGLGRALLAAAETRARQLGLHQLRLYTGSKLTDRVAWYGRHGFTVSRIDELPDRSITHMAKTLAPA